MELCIFVEAQQGATYDQQLAVAEAAEDGGFDAFFRSDHFLAIGGAPRPPGPTDSWVTLAGLARDTRQVRLGTLVSAATFRHPGPLAVAVAQVDAMSGGRVELGLGAGWNDAEHRAYAIPFPPLRERFERLGEQLEIIHGMWRAAEDETFTYVGRHYAAEDSPALPKPVQRPHPPIIMGGYGERRTPELAARFADEFNAPPFSTVEQFGTLRDGVRAACERLGRDHREMRFSAAVPVCCGRDEAELGQRSERIGMTAEVARERLAGAGLPGEVVERLSAWKEAGADRLYLQLLDPTDAEHVELLGVAVQPALR